MSIRRFTLQTLTAVFALASAGVTQAAWYWPYTSYYSPYAVSYTPYAATYAPTYAATYSPSYAANYVPAYSANYSPVYSAGYAPYTASYAPYTTAYAPYSAAYSPYYAGYSPYAAYQPVVNGYYYPRRAWGWRRWTGYSPYTAGYRPYGLAYQPYAAGYSPYVASYAPTVVAPTVANYAPYSAGYVPAAPYATSYAPTLSPATTSATTSYYPTVQASATESNLPVVMAPPTYVDRRPSANTAPTLDSYTPRRSGTTFCPTEEEPRRLPGSASDPQTQFYPAREPATNTSSPRAIRDDRNTETVYRRTAYRANARDVEPTAEAETVNWHSSR